MKKKIAIVGAGVGGLATAARLSSRGYEVNVFEKLPECGGRAHFIEDKGFKFDTGPSFVLMPDFFQEVFSYCRKNAKDYLNLAPLDIHYRIFYASGQTFTVYRDTEKTKQELERIEAGSSLRYEAFINEVGKIYKAVKPLLYQCFTLGKLRNPFYWNLLWKLQTNKTYWQVARKFFKTEELCYALTFEAMFIGVSPFHAPAVYSIITYTDHVQKIYHPLGGMYQIPLALEEVAREYKTRFYYQNEISEVRLFNDGCVLATQEGNFEADHVVINADYVHAQKDLLKRQVPQYKYSCSVFLLYLGLKKKVRGLEHHNLFFAPDLYRNLAEIFKEGVVPLDPSFYVHVPTVTDSSLAPPSKEIAYILIPVPNLALFKGEFRTHEETIKKFVFAKINQVIGEDIEQLIEVQHAFYPKDFLSRYNVINGATFGLAHTLMQSAFFRPSNIDKQLKNIFYAGCSTQPGGGLPPVIASSRIVADAIEKG